MAQIILDVSAKIANYIKRKGFAEIFIRDNMARCEEIAKILFKTANKGQKDKITNIAMNAVRRIGVSDNALAEFQNNLLKQIDPQMIRKQLGKIMQSQLQGNAIIKNLAKNVSGIYSAMSSLQVASWLNVALSAANLAATVASTVIICDKLDHIDKKLDRIEGKIDAVARVQFVTQIRQPCRTAVMGYKVIAADLNKGEEVPAGKMLDAINQCCNLMETIYSLRQNYSTGDVLELLYDLMPVFTDLIVLYYQHYFDSAHGEHALHQDWMKIYDLLDSTEFRNYVQDYLIIVEHTGNRQVNEIMDCQRLVTIGSKQRIEEVLLDLRLCESAADYRDIMQFSNQYAQQQARVMEEELRNQLGYREAEQILAPAKKMYMFAD